MSASNKLRFQKNQNQIHTPSMRMIQIWLPDTRKKSFVGECRRQSLLLKNDPLESEIYEWLDQVRDTKGWKQ
jgi:hypothetical protein